MVKSKVKQIKRSEIILLSIFGCIALLGFIISILGIIAFSLPTVTKNNPLYSAQVNFAKWLGIGSLVDFRILGTIIMVIGVVFLLVVLQHYASKHDEIQAKIQRKEERRKNLMRELELQKAREEELQKQQLEKQISTEKNS